MRVRDESFSNFNEKIPLYKKNTPLTKITTKEGVFQFELNDNN